MSNYQETHIVKSAKKLDYERNVVIEIGGK